MDQVGIVFLDASTVGEVSSLNQIKKLGKYTEYDLTMPQDTISRIGDNSVVITNKVIIDKHVMDACPRLRLICISATGMNNIDLSYAEKKGIKWFRFVLIVWACTSIGLLMVCLFCFFIVGGGGVVFFDFGLLVLSL